MKKVGSALRALVIIAASAVIAAACGGCARNGNAGRETGVAEGAATAAMRHATTADTIREIVSLVQEQSRLYTAECRVHKIVLYDDRAHFDAGIFDVAIPGTRKVAIPIDVTLKGYVDFGGFDERNVRLTDSLCIITLPDPHVTVTASKVDHEGTRQYVSLTRSRFGDADLQRIAAMGADSVANHVASYGIVERSRESCVRTIVPLMCKLGFKDSNIVVRFRKTFDDGEMRVLTSRDK